MIADPPFLFASIADFNRNDNLNMLTSSVEDSVDLVDVRADAMKIGSRSPPLCFEAADTTNTRLATGSFTPLAWLCRNDT